MKRIRIGFIGAGRINSTHMDILSRQPGVEIVGVADVDLDKARNLAKLYNTAAYPNYQDFLDSVDAVWLATPPNTRLEICREVVKRGKHVMAEKPIARTLQEAEEIVHLVNEAGVSFMVGFMKRFAPRFSKAFELLKSGEMGTPIWCVAHYNGPPNVWYGPSWCWDVNVSGGLVVENTSHYIDVMRWLLGAEVTAVYASLDRLYQRRGSIEDSGAIILHFDKPIVGVIACGMNSPERFPHEELKLVCTQGGLVAEASLTFLPGGFVENSQLTVYKSGSVETRNWAFSSAGYEEEDLYFLECLRNGRRPLIDAEEGRKVLEIAIAALWSAKTGQKIALPLEGKYRKEFPVLWG